MGNSGWNRGMPHNEESSNVRAKAPSVRRGIAAGLVIAVPLFAVLIFVFSRDEDASMAESRKRSGRIAEVVPAAAPKQEAETGKEKQPRRQINWKTVNTNGFNEATMRKWRFENRPKPSITNDVAKMLPKLRCEIFDTYSENTIAVLMTLEPGKGLTGLPRYGKDFEDDFMKSCETPIIVSAEDDDYTRQLKEDMKAVKIELRDRMAKGEKLGDIITEARKEAMRLAQIKRDILEETKKLVGEAGASDDDAQTYYEAANKLLESKGIAPIKPGLLNVRSLMRRVQNGGKYK